MEYPKKVDNLYLERLDGELCVYDWERKMVHALNPTAASVLEMCDGQTSVAQMAARLEEELNVPQAENVVWLSLAELEQADLLAEKVGDSKTLSRREMLKAMGVAVALLPVVTSIVAPTPAQAQTCVPNCTYIDFIPTQISCEEWWQNSISPEIPEAVLCSASSRDVGDGFQECTFEYFDPEGEGCRMENGAENFD